MNGRVKVRLLRSLANSDPSRLWRSALDAENPDEILDRCDAWRISGLVYRRLIEPIQTQLPDELVSGFRSRYATCVRDNLKRHQALEQVDSLFADRDIRALVVKGLALTLCVYRDPGVRQMSDTDLIVWPEHVNRAIESLGDLGYERDTSHPTVFTRNDNTLDVKPEPFGVDRIRSRETAFTKAVPTLWEQTERLDGFMAFRTWSPGARIYTLTVHGLKHGFPDGVWLTDLGETIASAPVSAWAKSIRLFAESGNERALFLGLMRTRDWGYQLPRHVDAWMRNTPKSGTLEVIRNLSSTRDAEHVVEALYLAVQSSGFSARFQCLYEALFPNEAIYRQDLPKSLAWLRSPLRIAHVITRSAKAVISKVQGA